MTGALTVWSGFTALCAWRAGFGSLFLCRMGVGIGEAGGVAPAYSLIADYFPKSQRARALAAYAFGIPLGMAAGTLVGGLLAATYGWRTAFIVVGVLGVLVAPVLRLTVKDPKRGGLDVEPAAPAAAPVEAPKAPPFMEVVRTLAPKPSFWLLSFGAAASSVCGYGVAAWLPSFFMRSFGLTLSQTAWYYSAIVLVGGVAGIWLGGSMADRLGKKSKAAYPLTPAIAFLISVPCFILAMNSGAVVGAVMPGSDPNGAAALTMAFLIFLIPTGLNLTWLGPITAAVQHLATPAMRTTGFGPVPADQQPAGDRRRHLLLRLDERPAAPDLREESLRWAIYTGMGFYLLSSALLFGASRTLKKDWVD
ncbi:L-galactonate transporter [Brevundimonas vancanneytii]|uniref:L-galactonate transporter n=1 Tax=Brevundimonas vancanneytii TaxID=1325724 RepID=A0A4P1KIQ4_9CAUL|nr:L-galactonate transporter [Brevundimonas vancanneytii]